MSVRILAQNLHAGSRRVARALRERDRPFLQRLARRLEALPIDGLDLGVGEAGLSAPDEAERLLWLLEIAATESSRELFLDSARIEVLTAVATRSTWPCSFNSIRDLDDLPEKALEVLRGSQGTVVLQLAPGGELPRGSDDRLRAAEEALEAADRRGLPVSRVWIDPVCLPWGDDVEAGRGLLDFLEEARRRWPGQRSVLGLSNVGWGHGDRSRLHREWLRRFLERGLGAVILDAQDEELWTALRL